jgi:S1-C subfamily serine protease
VNRRYIASLAVAAVFTLIAGLLARQRLRPAEPSAAVAPPSEASALQQLSQEGQVRRLSSFLSARATDVAALVEYVPASNASGLRWRSVDTLITTFADRPIVMLRVTRTDTTRAPVIAPSDSLRGEWALVVARRRDGGVVTTAGVVGGRLTTTCAGRDVQEYVLGVPISDGFAGAGLFDLDGRAIGIIARCGRRLIALPAGEMARLLSDPDSSGRRLRSRFGVTVRPLDGAARSYFGADSGLLVTEVGNDTPAELAGWLPGDIIAQIDGVSIDSVVPSAVLDSLASADSHVVVIQRGGASRTTRLSSSAGDSLRSAQRADVGVRFDAPRVPAGVIIEDVRPGSAADGAGIRPGDRLLRVGGVAVGDVTTARRLLDRLNAAGSVTFIVYQRDSVTRGVLLRR